MWFTSPDAHQVDSNSVCISWPGQHLRPPELYCDAANRLITVQLAKNPAGTGASREQTCSLALRVFQCSFSLLGRSIECNACSHFAKPTLLWISIQQDTRRDWLPLADARNAIGCNVQPHAKVLPFWETRNEAKLFAAYNPKVLPMRQFLSDLASFES